MTLVKALVHHLRAPEVIQTLSALLPRVAMVAAMLSAVAGCAALESAGPADQNDEFAHALSVCRFQHPGATNQRLALPATEEHIRQCLARRGWLPTGERGPAAGSP
jgi:hypothetical protein